MHHLNFVWSHEEIIFASVRMCVVQLRCDGSEIATSPGDIHFWIYHHATDNVILDLRRKSVFATLLRRYYFGPFYLCHETTRYYLGVAQIG